MPSIEETLRAACLISLYGKYSGYNGVDLAGGKLTRVWCASGGYGVIAIAI